MRHYPRAWNRIVAFFGGLFLLVVGVALALTQLWPWFAQQWKHYAQICVDWFTNLMANTPLAGTRFSWMHVAAIALAALVIIVCLVTIFKQSGGRTRDAVRFQSADEGANQGGTTTISTKFINEYVQDRLQDSLNISSVSVSSWKVKRDNGLLIRAKVVQGADVVDVYRSIDALTKDLDVLLGQAVPIMVRLSPGSAIAQTFQSAPRVM